MKHLKDLQLSTRITNALLKNGINSISQLKQISFDELLLIKGISKKSVEEIKSVIEKLQTNNISSKSFNSNNIYIFTKKKYIKSEGKKKYIANKDLINKLNGRLVINGIINGTEINRKWCISK